MFLPICLIIGQSWPAGCTVLDLKCFHYVLLAPAIAPLNVMAQRLSSTTMNISWSSLTLVEARGIFDYRIFYQPVNGRRRQGLSSVDVDGNNTFIIITGLTPGVEYVVTILAYNSEDGVELIGPASDPVHVPDSERGETDPGDSPNNVIIIVAATAGTVVVAVVIVALVIVIFVRRKNRKTNTEASSQSK